MVAFNLLGTLDFPIQVRVQAQLFNGLESAIEELTRNIPLLNHAIDDIFIVIRILLLLLFTLSCIHAYRQKLGQV